MVVYYTGMLIEELFARGVMTMGPSRSDPDRQVGVFRPELVAELPVIRATEMEKFRWIAGDWSYENRVPATRSNPAYTDAGCARFSRHSRSRRLLRAAYRSPRRTMRQ